jgi:hypothetical protein
MLLAGGQMDIHKLIHDIASPLKDLPILAFFGFLHKSKEKEKDLGDLEILGDNVPFILISNSSRRSRSL